MTSRLTLPWAPALIASLILLSACTTSREEKVSGFIARGRELLDRHEPARALLEFRNASQLLPDNPEAQYGIGLASMSTGNFGDAARAFRKVTALNPRHKDAQIKLAGLMMASRDPELLQEAGDRLEGVLANTPGNPEAASGLAILESDLGKTEEAEARLRDVLARSPKHLRSSVALARLKLSQKDADGAEQILRKAVENAPGSVDAATLLGGFYASRRKFDLAAAQISRALAFDPKHPSALLTLAQIQVGTKRLTEAEETYRQLSALPDKRLKWLYAKFLYDRGKRESAIREYKRLADLHPQDRMARTWLFAACVASGKLGDAQKLLDEALQQNPRDTDALLQRAELNLRLARMESAESDLRQLLALTPASAEAHFAMARLQRARGLSHRPELGEALRLNPGLLPARLALARSFVAAKDPASALATLRAAPAPQKSSRAYRIEYNWALLASGNSTEARKEIDRLLKTLKTPELILQDGFAKLSARNYPGSAAAAEEVLRYDPENMRAAGLLVSVYTAQKQERKALESVRSLVSQRPASAPLQMLLGRLSLSAGDSGEARKAFQAADAAAPQSADAAMALAELHFSENRLEDARRWLTPLVTPVNVVNGVNVDRQNVRAVLLSGHIEMQARNYDAAIERYKTVADLDSGNVIALNNLAYLIAIRSPDEAMKYARKAVELAPDHAPARDTLGWVYYRKGHYREAIEHFKAAMDRKPTPSYQFHLGLSYLKAGDRETGSKMVAAALTRDPKVANNQIAGW